MLNRELLQHHAATLAKQYRSLPPFRKKWIHIAALLLAILLAYGLIQTTWSFKQQARAQLDREQALLQLMQRHADGIRELNAARQAKTGNDTSLLALVSKTAGEHKLTLQRYEPGTDGKLAIWLSNADFNTLLAWVDQLTRQYNVRIDRASIVASGTAGLVEAQLQLRE
jgi:general secretion pathway protein M